MTVVDVACGSSGRPAANDKSGNVTDVLNSECATFQNRPADYTRSTITERQELICLQDARA
jgi:hypothetical protein